MTIRKKNFSPALLNKTFTLISPHVDSLRNIILFLLLNVLFFLNSAGADGLDKAKDILENFQDELLTIIPIIAVISLILLAIGYATKFVEKDTFVRWAIGVIIAGSAAQITAMFFS